MLLHRLPRSTLSFVTMQSMLRSQKGAAAAVGWQNRQSSSCINRQGAQRAVFVRAAAPALPKTEIELPKDIKRVLFSEHEVRLKVAELAREICRTHRGKKIAIIGVLNGAFIFTSGMQFCLQLLSQGTSP